MASLCDRILSRTAARYRHAVWVVALFLSFFLPVFSSATNFNAPPRVSIAPAPTTESVPVVVTRISSLAGDEIEPAESKAPAAPIAATAPGRNWSSPVRVNPRLAATLVAIYALLVFYALLRLARAWRQTRKIVRDA